VKIDNERFLNKGKDNVTVSRGSNNQYNPQWKFSNKVFFYEFRKISESGENNWSRNYAHNSMSCVNREKEQMRR